MLGNKAVPISQLIETTEGQAELKQLAARHDDLEVGFTAIMCAERNAKTCHRWIISQRLLEDYEINVLHISNKGSITSHTTVGEKSLECMITKEEFKAEVDKVVKRRETGDTADEPNHEDVRKTPYNTC